MYDSMREMLDRMAIREVLLRYAHAVDRRDLDMVRGCFMPDASYHGALGDGSISDALVALRQRMERYDSTMHLIGNQFIELAGDEAKSETYTIAYHRLNGEDEPNVLTVAVRYLDELIRHDGQWRIRARVVVQEWQRYDDVFLNPGGV